MAGRIRVGVGGWTYEPWRGLFYPDGLAHKRELEHMSRRLTAIEINGTFYSTFKPDSWRKWRDETPDDFVFTVKGSRYVTNRKVLAEAGPALERFVGQGLAELGPKLGSINWQLAGTKRFEPEDVDAFLSLLPREVDGVPLRHALEVRHPSFAAPEFVELLRKHRVAAVYADAEDWPSIPDATADFIYARLQRAAEDHPAGYPPGEINRCAGAVRAWADGGVPEGLPLLTQPASGPPRDVFVFFISGHKAHNPAAAEALLAALKS
jgi:uncharacterized protein YecE (DUF72 family)